MPELNPEALSPEGRHLLAFSGGPDSTCLLWTLHRAGLGDGLRLVHLDHGLDSGSAERAREAQRIAAAIGSNCEIRRIEVPRGRRDGGPEAAARRARYACLRTLMRTDEYLLTAHHADDQAETMLLQLLRGAGPEGLAGLRDRRRFGPGWLARPLLYWTRAEIEDAVTAAGLRAVVDPSNRDRRHDRNFLRHEVLPLIERRWPGYRSAIAAAAARQQHAAVAVRDRASGDWQELGRTLESGEQVVQQAGWLALTPGAALEVIRDWCRRAGMPPPSGGQLDEFRRQCSQAAPDSQPQLAWSAGRLHAWAGSIWLDPGAPPGSSWRVDWRETNGVDVPAGGRLSLEPRPDSPFGQHWQIAPVPAGARLRLRPDGPNRRVAELLRRSGVPPWRRCALPCLHVDGRLCAVATDWLDHELASWLEECGSRLLWRGRPATLLPCGEPDRSPENRHG